MNILSQYLISNLREISVKYIIFINQFLLFLQKYFFPLQRKRSVGAGGAVTDSTSVLSHRVPGQQGRAPEKVSLTRTACFHFAKHPVKLTFVGQLGLSDTQFLHLAYWESLRTCQ